MKKATETDREIPDQNLKSQVNLAIKMGALEAKLIDTRDIIVGDWVRLKCQYGCGAYGKSLTCPPYSPTPQQMRQILNGYSTAILMQVADESTATQDMIANLERSIFLNGHYRAFGVSAGPCERCEKCGLEKCVHPKLARPSVEACGIDVYATARQNGFSIEVRKSPKEKPTYFALVLVE
ncbi:MAG: DUF2284 domain-containing protein [Candidatus Bathyarchaeia archaeon]|jgi:predicted metal-binding protein